MKTNTDITLLVVGASALTEEANEGITDDVSLIDVVWLMALDSNSDDSSSPLLTSSCCSSTSTDLSSRSSSSSCSFTSTDLS